MKKNKIRTLINIFLVIIFLFSSYKIVQKIINYKKADNVYKEIQEIKDKNIEKNNETLDLSYLNKDYRGWLTINNTNINYPILQGKDNNYYLDKDINKNYLASGSIFLDFRNNKFDGENTILYGHSMKNDTMFAQLDKFKEKEFFNENNKIVILTPAGKKLTYEVFSAYITDLKDNYNETNFKTENEYRNFLNKIENKSIVKSKLKVIPKDKILTLSTCSYEYEGARMVVHAKLMEILQYK
ncbi:class B sortase [[Eubacterium] tenue]|nr:class B sortase [[Eubacterium] tenue]MBC8631744.1 class B sortase [[Eubacterium] tenue]